MGWLQALLAVVAAFIFAAACLLWAMGLGDPPKRPGFVAQQWADSIRELSISPLFPPREDVEVGDIYLESADDKNRAPGLTGAGQQYWLANLKLGKAVSEVYRSRVALPFETTNPETQKPWPLPQSDEGVFRTDRDAKRLRGVSFPAYAVASIRSADIGASSRLTDLLGGFFGVAGQRSYTITVGVPYAQSYGLPALEMLRRIGEYCDVTGDDLAERAAVLASMMAADDKPKTPVLEVITEVIYARSLDYTVSFRYGGGASFEGVATNVEAIKRKLIEIAERKSSPPNAAAAPNTAPPPKGEAGKSAPEPPPGTGQNPTAEKELAELQAIGASLEQVMASMRTTSAPGVSGRFVSADSQSVTLRQTFANPIAIGYRALAFSLPRKAGSAAPSGAASEPEGLPVFKPCSNPSLTALPPVKPVDPPQGLKPKFLVFFDWGKSSLTPEDQSRIREAANVIRTTTNPSITIEGHADASGEPKGNISLSERRANEVEKKLIEAQVPPTAIKAVRGLGSSKLRLPTPPQMREPENRRVEIIVE